MSSSTMTGYAHRQQGFRGRIITDQRALVPSPSLSSPLCWHDKCGWEMEINMTPMNTIPFLLMFPSSQQAALNFFSTTSASSMRLTLPSPDSLLATANCGMGSPSGLVVLPTATANEADLLCCNLIRSLIQPAAGTSFISQ